MNKDAGCQTNRQSILLDEVKIYFFEPCIVWDISPSKYYYLVQILVGFALFWANLI